MIVERDYNSEYDGYDEYIVKIADSIKIRFGKYYIDSGRCDDQNYYINVNSDLNYYFNFDHYKPFINKTDVVNYIIDKVKEKTLDVLIDIEAYKDNQNNV